MTVGFLRDLYGACGASLTSGVIKYDYAAWHKLMRLNDEAMYIMSGADQEVWDIIDRHIHSGVTIVFDIPRLVRRAYWGEFDCD